MTLRRLVVNWGLQKNLMLRDNYFLTHSLVFFAAVYYNYFTG
jgi:hypothetical protein